MKIYVSSRRGVNDLINRLSGSICVISITDPDEPTAVIERDERDILRQQFHDLDRFHSQLKEVTYFSHSHAAIIATFVHKNLQKDNMVIHCEAGISRSPAIAAAICNHLNLPGWWKFFHKCMPNLMVLTILRSELGWK